MASCSRKISSQPSGIAKSQGEHWHTSLGTWGRIELRARSEHERAFVQFELCNIHMLCVLGAGALAGAKRHQVKPMDPAGGVS
jgi:hypothetical protein